MEAILSTPVSGTRTRRTERLVDNVKLVAQRAGEKARERARAADRIVRDHPYHGLGIALGVGLLVGVLAWRRWHAAT